MNQRGGMARNNHSKNKTPVLGNAIRVLDVKLKAGVERILVIFQDRSTYVQPYHSKGLGESFPLMWLNVGLS